MLMLAAAGICLVSLYTQAGIDDEVDHVMISDPENLDILYNIDIKD